MSRKQIWSATHHTLDKTLLSNCVMELNFDRSGEVQEARDLEIQRMVSPERTHMHEKACCALIAASYAENHSFGGS